METLKNYLLISFTLVFIIGCTSITEKEISEDTLVDAIEYVKTLDFDNNKEDYVIESLDKKVNSSNVSGKSWGEYINESSSYYNKLYKEFVLVDSIVNLIDCSYDVSLDGGGMKILMNIEFKHSWEKEVKFIECEYYHLNKYDEYNFHGTTKVHSDIVKDFKESKESLNMPISEYSSAGQVLMERASVNLIGSFMQNKLDLVTQEDLKWFKEGFRINAIKVVFEDGTEVERIKFPFDSFIE